MLLGLTIFSHYRKYSISLQKLSSSPLGSSPHNDNQIKHFLQCIFKTASGTDRVVIQINKIRVCEEINYTQGQLIGQANNNHGETVTVFLVNWCFGHKKKIVKLIPINK